MGEQMNNETNSQCTSSDSYHDGRNIFLINANEWIRCADRMPEEHETMFNQFYGTDKWHFGMFRKASPELFVTIEYDDGSRIVGKSRTMDGEWNLAHYIKKHVKRVVAWMENPKPYEGE